MSKPERRRKSPPPKNAIAAIVQAGLSGEELVGKIAEEKARARELVAQRQDAARAEIVAIEKKYEIAVLPQPVGIGSPGPTLFTVAANLMLVPFEAGATSLLDTAKGPPEGQVDDATPEDAS